jgi:class 3 adenylate cyclase/tetratricopeptide (TPR) repeat protein
MICPRCHAENLSGTRFCGQCGTPLSSICGSCGASNPAENKFCGQCGTSIVSGNLASIATVGNAPAQAVPTGEFKQVTVLFCDIVNSTGLAERIGAEPLHELLRRFLDTGIAEVRRFGGTVPQFTGDGFMALFGAPIAHEDHVRRALLAAVAIRRAVAGNAEGLADPEAAMPIRIGLNTGLVVFGPVADKLRMDSTATGDAANIAARLQEAAEPGNIVISEATFRLARGYVVAEPIGALRLKGKTETVSALRLIEVLSGRHVFDELPGVGSRIFVGRDRELTVLEQLLSEAESGNGQAVGIVGEPGIGKSRLIAEFHRSLTGRPASWSEGRCVSYGTAIPYLLMLDLLRSFCQIVDTDTPAAIAQKVRAGLRKVGGDPDTDGPLLLGLLGIGNAAQSGGDANPEAVKARAFNLFRRIAITASQRQLLVLAVEDLQWIDKVSEEFLGFLAETLPGVRILLLATYRPGYRPPWIDKSYAAQIPLHPLVRQDSQRVLDAVVSQTRLAEILAKTILAKAEGNPFFLEQLALHAGEDRGIEVEQSLPATIRDVVMARIDRLPEQTRRLLQIAAVIGREFSLRVVSEVWDAGGPLEPLLRHLLQLEFLYERLETDETTYVFRHALTQDAAYAGLLTRDRQQIHYSVGRALERLYPGRSDEIAELLALHYGNSDDADKAVDYTIMAAEKAQRRWANSEALAYFDTALHRINAMPDTQANRLRRVDAVLKQIEVKLALGRHAEHVDALAAMRSAIEEIDDPRRSTTWHYWMGFLGCLTGGHPAEAIDHCREAAAIAAAAGFDELDGDIQSCLAQAYTVAGELRAAIEAGERAVSIFEARGNRWYASRALWHLSTAANYLGEWEASLAYCRRAFEHGVALNDVRLKAVALWRTGSAHIQRGDTQPGLQCCEEALALSPIAFDAANSRAMHGYGLIKSGRVDAGIAELAEAAAWFESSRLPYIRAHMTLWLVEGYLARGDRSSVRPLLDDVLNISQATGYVQYEAFAHRLMAECLAADDAAAAAEHVDTALFALERIGGRNNFAKALVTKAGLRQAAGDVATARQLLQQASEIFRELGTLDEPSRIEAALAAMERDAGNVPQNRDALRRPLRENGQHLRPN